MQHEGNRVVFPMNEVETYTQDDDNLTVTLKDDIRKDERAALKEAQNILDFAFGDGTVKAVLVGGEEPRNEEHFTAEEEPDDTDPDLREEDVRDDNEGVADDVPEFPITKTSAGDQTH